MDESSACHKQVVGDDNRLYCTIAVEQYYHEPHAHLTTARHCKGCSFGEWARKIKCGYLDGTVLFIEITGMDGLDYMVTEPSFYCLKTQESLFRPNGCVDKCSIRDDADFALPILETSDYLTVAGCEKAAYYLNEARAELVKSPRTERDNENVVNNASIALAEALRFILKRRYSFDTGQSNIGPLWAEYRKRAQYKEESRYEKAAAAIIEQAEVIRHNESRAHDPKRTPSYAETVFYLTVVAGVIHYLVRKEITEKNGT
jgi:hypothetical protein